MMSSTDTIQETTFRNLCNVAMEKQFDVADYNLKCKRAAGVYHLFLGSAYNVAQSVMVDAAAELRKHKDLYRFQVKKDVTEALKAYDMVFSMERKDLGVMYEAWLDVIDIMDDELKSHLEKMYWSIDSLLMKHNVKEHRLIARMETAYAVISVARKSYLSLCRVLESEIFHHKMDFSGLRWFSFKDVLFHWQRACDTLARGMGLNGIDLPEDKNCSLALNVIVSRLTDFKRIDRNTETALNMHPEVDPRINDGIEQLKEKYNKKNL